jgi:hypothetical protein
MMNRPRACVLARSNRRNRGSPISLHFSVIEFYELADGRIAGAWLGFDVSELMRQLAVELVRRPHVFLQMETGTTVLEPALYPRDPLTKTASALNGRAAPSGLVGFELLRVDDRQCPDAVVYAQRAVAIERKAQAHLFELLQL